jgi:hypothetical protein
MNTPQQIDGVDVFVRDPWSLVKSGCPFYKELL